MGANRPMPGRGMPPTEPALARPPPADARAIGILPVVEGDNEKVLEQATAGLSTAPRTPI
jgi:hypothetical protein